MSMYRRWLAGLLAVAAMGCAQNIEPAGRQIQSNRGPNTPQDQRIVYNIIAGDYYAMPTSQPAADAAIADKTETAMWARANPSTGLASVQGPRNGRNHNVSIWTDASSAASPSVGSMNPNASQSQPVDATQRPQTELTAAVPVTVGMPGSATSGTANANGAANFGSGTNTGGAQTSTANPTQSGFSATLKTAQDQFAQILQQLLAAWQAQSAKTEATTKPAS